MTEAHSEPLQAEVHAPPSNANLFERDWDVPWHAHLVPVVLAIGMVGFWLAAHGQMSSYAVSWVAIRQDRISPLFLHIFAHGGLPHILMNLVALLILGGPLISRLGKPPLSWARFIYLFIGSGVAGAAMFLLMNRDASLSVLGASGSVFGLVAALARVHPITGELVGITSQRTWSLFKFFVGNHFALFALIAVVAVVSGRAIGLAWEAHLGGLLFGFFTAAIFLPAAPRTNDQVQSR